MPEGLISFGMGLTENGVNNRSRRKDCTKSPTYPDVHASSLKRPDTPNIPCSWVIRS